MQKTDNNPRRDFLKMISVVTVSFGALSFFKSKKSGKYSEEHFNTLSKSEADEIVKNEEFTASTRLNPEPAPVAQKNIKG